MNDNRLTDVTARLMTMRIGDEWLDPGSTPHQSRVYATARKLKQRYGVAFRAVSVPEGVKVVRIASDCPRKIWRGGTLEQRATAELNRQLEQLPIGGSVWVADGPLARAAGQLPDQYVADREGNGWRVYRLA